MENPFKPRSVSQDAARALRPNELERAQMATEAAVAEGLGSRPVPSELSDDELQTAGHATLERRDALGREGGALRKDLFQNFSAQAEEEFVVLLASKEGRDRKEQRAIGDLEHAIGTQKSFGIKDSGALRAILDYADMDEFEDRTTGLFSQEIQAAVRAYRSELKLLEERRRVPGSEGTRIQKEIDARKDS